MNSNRFAARRATWLTSTLLVGVLSSGASAQTCTPRWSPLGSGVTGPHYPAIVSLTTFRGELVAAGRFATAGGVISNGVATWNGTGWTPLGSGFGRVSEPAIIIDLIEYQGELIAAGTFNSAGGVSANNIASWNGHAWRSIGAGTNGTVSSLAVYNGELIIGGQFTSAGGLPANRIARLNDTAAQWAPLGTGITGSGTPGVSALAVYNGELYAGGRFNSAGGVPVGNLARWNGTTWQTVGTGVTGSHVSSLIVFNSELVIGGYFTVVGEIAVNSIARWNGGTWSTFSTGMSDNVNGFALVNGLTTFNNRLIAAGVFSHAGGVLVNNIAQWSGQVWQPLGSGTSGEFENVIAVTQHGESLFVGGQFQTAGGVGVERIARWGAPLPQFVPELPWCSSVSPGSNASFTVSVQTSPAPALQWRRNGVPIDPVANPTAITTTLMLTNVQAGDAASYDCVATGACGSVTSNAATLSIGDGCAGDLNCDGLSNSQDFFMFLPAFFSGAGDFNSDSETNSQDYFDFLSAFFAGC